MEGRKRLGGAGCRRRRPGVRSALFPFPSSGKLCGQNLMASSPTQPASLSLLSIVIPARDEEGCITSTVERLHLELRLHQVPHEIIVVDDGSTDRTWELILGLQAQMLELVPVRNQGQHGFGRAIICGLDRMKGDAVVIMMADESDDSRDVVRYW
jgi:dolichol-phosphate mannosyltransferase